MIRGLMSGAVMGLFVGGAGLSIASLTTEPPAGVAPPAPPQVDAPQSADVDVAAPTQQPALPAAAADAPNLRPVPAVDTPTLEAQVPLADTAPADVPQTGTQAVELGTPSTATAAPDDISADAPVLPNPQSVAPQVPVAEGDVVVATDPGPAPASAEPATATEPVIVEVAPELAPDVAPGPAADPVIAADPSIAPVTRDTAPATMPDPAQDDLALLGSQADQQAAPQAPLAMETPAADALPMLPEAEITPLPETEPSNTAEQSDVATAEAPNTFPTGTAGNVVVNILDDRAASLPAGDGSVQVNRSFGSRTEPDAVPEVAEADSADGPALTTFNAAFDNPQDLPLASVILIDDGSLDGAVAAVASIPFPVSVALSPGRADAAAIAAAYRAAGIEVLGLINLPDAPTAADIATFMETAVLELPQSIGVLDAGTGGLPTEQAVLNETMATLATAGQGFVSVSRGLNASMRAAEKAAVPAIAVFRDLDSGDQDAAAVRRFLDQAAFRARQESGVVLLARVRAETLSALILWEQSNRASQVALAPVSAVLNAQ